MQIIYLYLFYGHFCGASPLPKGYVCTPAEYSISHSRQAMSVVRVNRKRFDCVSPARGGGTINNIDIRPSATINYGGENDIVKRRCRPARDVCRNVVPLI